MFPPVAVICVPQGYVFPRLQGQVQGRHLHPRGETVHHGAVPDLALMDAAGTSQPHVCIIIALVIATARYYRMADATRRRANCVTCIPTCMATSLRASRSYLSAFRLPLRPSIDVVLFQMEEEKWQAIFNYVANKKYPAGYSKSQKYVLRRSCKSYVVEGGKRLFSRHL